MRLIFWLNGWLVRMLCVLSVVVIAVMAVGRGMALLAVVFRLFARLVVVALLIE